MGRIESTKDLAIAWTRNRKGRSDGDEFKRELEAYCRYLENCAISYVAVEAPAAGTHPFRTLINSIQCMTDGLDSLAIFAHGLPTGLPDFKANLKNITILADAIAKMTTDVEICLYCCSTGRSRFVGPNPVRNYRRNRGDAKWPIRDIGPRHGFAVMLASELVRRGCGCEIWAHGVAGHTTKNKIKYRISGYRDSQTVERTDFWAIGDNRFVL